MAIALTISGFASILAKFVILREILLLCGGNILLCAIPLGIWSASLAGGFFLADKLSRRISDPYKAYMYTQMLIAVVIASALLFIKFTGTMMFPSFPALAITLFSIIAILPLSFLLGTLISFGRQMISHGKIDYSYRNATLTLSGIIASPFIIIMLNPIRSAGIAGVLMALSSIFIYKNFVAKKRDGKISRLVLFALVLALNIVLIFPYGEKIQSMTSDLTSSHGTLAR
jgi:hypothetical protein